MGVLDLRPMLFCWSQLHTEQEERQKPRDRNHRRHCIGPIEEYLLETSQLIMCIAFSCLKRTLALCFAVSCCSGCIAGGCPSRVAYDNSSLSDVATRQPG